MRSLVIEDEPQIAAYLGRLLDLLHGIVDIVGSVSEAKQALGNFKYDLAILDRMLPAPDVVMALSQLPERSAFLVLTAKDAKEDVIDGLNSGADDYLGKPFEPLEFIARMRGRDREMAQVPAIGFPVLRSSYALQRFGVESLGGLANATCSRDNRHRTARLRPT
jgi:DNA-binding response OmpR family regulator